MTLLHLVTLEVASRIVVRYFQLNEDTDEKQEINFYFRILHFKRLQRLFLKMTG
jgi:hypothetical protein